MGIETVFIGIFAIFVITALGHGYKRELGVTIVLMLTMGVLKLIDAKFSVEVNSALDYFVSGNSLFRTTVLGLLYCLVLLLAVFVAYQSELLRFPGSESSAVLSLGSGVLNGYLLAGSIWYYLAQANWPFVPLLSPFSTVYRFAWPMLPPNVLAWPLLFGSAMVMLTWRWLKKR